MDPKDLPTLGTYVEIFKDIIATWSNLGDCEPWAQPFWATTLLTYVSIILIIFYLYVIIFGILPIRRKLNASFRRAIFVLAFGELIILFFSMREAVVQDCILDITIKRQIAWQSVGAAALEIIIGTNLVMSLTRMASIFGHEKIAAHITNIGLLLTLLWAICMFVFYFRGWVNMVYFVEDEYFDKMLPSFDVIRMPILMIEVGTTAFCYILSCFAIQRYFGMSRSTRIAKREKRIFIMCVIIFLVELEFIYATFWLGDVFEIGSDEFNGNLDYTSRPLAMGVTPIFYICFSSEIRQSLLSSFPLKFFFKGRVYPSTAITPVRSSTLSSG